MTPLQERFRDLINQKLYYEGKSPTDISKACSEITLEMMGKFAEWLRKNYFPEAGSQYGMADNWFNITDGEIKEFSTSELIQKFLNEMK